MANSVVGPKPAPAETPAPALSLLTDARLQAAAAAGVILLAFGYYVYLIDANPGIFWYDAIHRYAFPDDLTVDRWLPGSQVVIFVMRQLSSDETPVRIALAAVSCLCLFAAWAFTRHVSTPMAGLVVVVALFTNFVFVSLATVPYGETLFMGCVLGALVLLDRPESDAQFYAGTALLAGACLTRYEAWFLAAIFLAERAYAFYRGDRDKRNVVFCVVVITPMLLWLAFGSSYTRPGESSIHERLTFDHLTGFARDYGRLLRYQEVDPWMLLAPIGFALAWLKGTHRASHLRALAFSALTVTMIVLVEPYAGLNFRSTFVPLIFVHIYAAIGLVMLVELALTRLRQDRITAGHAVLAVLLPVIAATGLAVYHESKSTVFVERASREPHYYGAQLAGRWLREQPREGAAIYALTDDILQHFSIAGMSDTDPDRVLQNDAVRPEPPSGRTYVLAVYRDEGKLSRNEKALLDSLTSGRIRADMTVIGPARAWVIDP